MKTAQEIMEDAGLYGLVKSLLDALSEVTLCPTCEGTKTFTPECYACLCGETEKCTCSTMEPETCPQCDGIGRAFSGSKKAEEIMKTAEQIMEEARNLREEAIRRFNVMKDPQECNMKVVGKTRYPSVEADGDCYLVCLNEDLNYWHRLTQDDAKQLLYELVTKTNPPAILQRPNIKHVMFGLGLAVGALIGVTFMALVIIVMVKFF